MFGGAILWERRGIFDYLFQGVLVERKKVRELVRGPGRGSHMEAKARYRNNEVKLEMS